MTFVTRLKLPKIKENLRPLIAADKELSSLFMAERLRKIGLQQHFREVYKPITEETKTIASKIEEGTKQAAQQAEVLTQNIQEGNVYAAEAARIAAQEAERAAEHARVLQEIKSQPKIMEMITLLKNYPNVVKALVEEEDVKLNNRDLEIIKLINKLPDEKLLMLSNYYKQEPKPKLKKVPFNERSFPDASKLFGDLQHANNNHEKIKELLNNASESEIDYLKFETARRNFPNLYNIRTFAIINSFIPNFIKDVKKYEKECIWKVSIFIALKRNSQQVKELNFFHQTIKN